MENEIDLQDTRIEIQTNDTEENMLEIDHDDSTTFIHRLFYAIPFVITILLLSSSIILYYFHLRNLDRLGRIWLVIPSYVMLWVSLYKTQTHWSGAIRTSSLPSQILERLGSKRWFQKLKALGIFSYRRVEEPKLIYPTLANPINAYERTRTKKVRYCHTCHIYKPDRCHHCSICDSCILR
jgi:palmitoyltransferase